MDAYLRLLIEGTALIGCTLVVLWIFLMKVGKSPRLNMRDASLSSEELEGHAKRIAIEHAVSIKKRSLKSPIVRMNENYKFILNVYQDLNDDLQKKAAVPPASEWLLDNFYIIEKQVKGMRRDLKKSDYNRLPILKSGPLKGQIRIFAVAVELVTHTDGQIDEKILTDYLKAYQSHAVLFDREIVALPTMITLALIENIRVLCEEIKNTRNQWHKADKIFVKWLENEEDDTRKTIKLFEDRLQSLDEANPSFVEHLFYRLRRSGRSYVEVLRTMDENLNKLGATTEEITQKEHGVQSVNTISMGNTITSIHFFSALDWSELFEAVSMVEQILKQDPDGTYPLMDIATRSHYRTIVEELALGFGVSEIYLAKEAIQFAAAAYTSRDGFQLADPAVQKTWHVGYYLIGKGLKSLEKKEKKINSFRPKAESMGIKNPGVLYLGSMGLITLLFLLVAVRYSNFAAPTQLLPFSVLAIIAVLIPASEIAVAAVNWIVCNALKPAFFPRLQLREGIPESMSTIVAVPTLLSDKKRVTELLAGLESHYLANREEHLYFALVGAFSDADKSVMKADPGIIETALAGIRALNLKYAPTGIDKFYFFHRDSQYNEKNDKWFGWERKRGALMEFNDLILGASDTSFAYVSAKKPPFDHIKYVITLDSDTILPMGMAKKMIATMAHPLNRPVIDSERGVVVEGYGLMQPRIEVENESSNKSLFSRIFTGQEGIDPYATAISDVYQDLFGEGIFVGKGIYDLAVFQTIMRDAIPDNTILSHDLLEGSYVRTGLVTDLKLVDSYPSKYNSFSARLHRWVRGDWQLVPILFRKIFDRRHDKIFNPLSRLSKWKMFDNLRRSLVPPSLMLLVFLSFSVLPGSIFFWLGFFLLPQIFPLLMGVIGYLVSARFGNDRIKRYMPVMFGLKAVLMQFLLVLIFLPYQAWLMGHAIIVTLTRVFITRKNLLEWVTADDAEKFQKNSLGAYLFTMKAALIQAPVVVCLALFLKPETLVLSLFFFAMWISSPFIAWFISKDQPEKAFELSESEAHELGRITRKTWRYFEDFANAKSHYLIPDNYQADPPRGLAQRTSPTNIGLGLLAPLAARDFGYIGTGPMIELIDKTVTTIEELEKWQGHLLNWYDTLTLKPLRPAYISTVDSGNFLCYLVTLKQGLKDYLDRPLIDPRFANGIRDTLHCAGKMDYAAYGIIRPVDGSGKMADLMEWNLTLETLMRADMLADMDEGVWKTKITEMITHFREEMATFLPGPDLLKKMPDSLTDLAAARREAANDDVFEDIENLKHHLMDNNNLIDLPKRHQETAIITERLTAAIKKWDQDDYRDALAWLIETRATMNTAATASQDFIDQYTRLLKRIDVLVDSMEFLPLYDKKKELFSIGFNLEDNKLTNSFYDLLASEARQTSYICIAKGKIPASHWFKLGRALTTVDHYKGLISWTGTMFEYLMPLLIMKSYQNTLLDETYSFVIKSQKKYGNQREMPWGTSESGFNAMDKHHDYKYKAIGVPWLGLKRGLIEDAVTAPYATFLALMVDPEAAIKNIKRLKSDGLEGPYGFYEAADYTPERLGFETKRAVVKSFMAHHQGMSLLALDNCLNQNIMQTRFHTDPEIHAARLLLQEKVSSDLIFTKGTKEKLVPYKGKITREKSAVRHYLKPNSILPKAHILSNGNYSVMITDRGTGYSKSKMAAVTRWREDSTLDQYGMFFYLKNLNSKAVWSAAYGPLNNKPDQYEVVFTADKATFKRTDGDIETKTEVVVASGDNVEIRRMTLKNNGKKSCVLELTSYFELVMATQAGDIAHPAFGNLFIETEIKHNRKCLIANRRPRSDSDKSMWLANAVVVKGNTQGEIQYETDRMQLIGRGNNSKNPLVINQEKPLSNTSGPVLDPVMSMRIKVKIEAGKTAQFSFVTAFCESRESILHLIDKYDNSSAVEGAFKLALTRSQVETRYLNLDADETELYQDMISHLVFISPIRMMSQEIICQNSQGQSALWKYGISGDNPIVLVDLSKIDQVKLLAEVLKAHEYWRLMDLKVDLVILSEEEYSYSLPLYALISDMVLSKQTHDILNTNEDVFILEKNKIAAADIPLLYAVARVILTGDRGTMREQIECVRETATVKLNPEKIVVLNQPIDYPVVPTDQPERLYNNGIGGFKTDGSEYIIHLASGENTPAPWVNVIANPRFGFIVSESGSGYSWYQNSRENKLTPWSNDVVSDPPGEVIYLGDGDTGEIWTITPLPIREAEDYTVKHGFGYSNFEHASHGIKQRMTQFVPTAEAVKISLINLKNESNQERHLTLTYYIRPVLGVSDQATAMHINADQDEAGALLIKNPYNEGFPGEILFIDTSIPERSVTSDRKVFFGNGDSSSPDGLTNVNLDGVLGTGFDPCGAIQVKVTLGPNERKDIAFLLGAANNRAEVAVLTEKYRELRNVQEALYEVINFWKSKLGVIQVETATESINLMVNGWLQYQVISCRLWGRSGFYQAGGAYGFRDQLQDVLAITNIWPEIARAQILLHASHQYLQGDVQHWWHEPMGLGTRTHFSDDRLWLPYVTAEYIRITGDRQILEEEVNFIEEPELGEFEDEKCGRPEKIETAASLYEHCLRAVEISLKFGKHGLPLMGSGDWNDGMNTVGNKGRGESVWLGWFLIANLDLFIPICKEQGDLERAEKYQSVKTEMIAAIEKTAWDGSWYRRAYFDNGDVLGSAGNSECKIDSIAQSWSVISEAGESERSLQAMNSLEDYLVSREDGLIKLLTPPFDKSALEPGYIKGYIPGVRENGGQYTHAAAWAIIAFAKMGDGDKAWELFELINPINHTTNMRDYTRYKVEPYVLAADVYSTYPHTGRGGWTWYTGAAGWMYRAGLEYILGFQKNGETIVMDPCIPGKMKEYQISYNYLETNYQINIKNPDGVNKGVKTIAVDGIISTRNMFNLVNDQSHHQVDVLMGL